MWLQLAVLAQYLTRWTAILSAIAKGGVAHSADPTARYGVLPTGPAIRRQRDDAVAQLRAAAC